MQEYTYENLMLNKGDDFGCFEMGSTIVMLSEPSLIDYSANVGEKVKFGQTIGTLADQ